MERGQITQADHSDLTFITNERGQNLLEDPARMMLEV